MVRGPAQRWWRSHALSTRCTRGQQAPANRADDASALDGPHPGAYWNGAMLAASAEDIALLLCLLRRDHDGTTRCVRARHTPLDGFVDFVVSHHVSILVLNALDDSPLRPSLAAQQIDMLEQRRRHQLTRAQQLLEALEHLTDRFETAGLRCMLLKGPYLATRFYGDVHAREFYDLDLLVPWRERGRAFQLLGEAGYARKSRVLLDARLTGFFVHGFDFTDGRALVDLHWCLSRQPSVHVDDATLWKQTQTFRLSGRAYAVLSDEHEIVFAVLSLLRDLERGRPKVKNLIDLFQILEGLDARLDWNAFFTARRTEGTLGPVVNILSLCLDIANAGDVLPELRRAIAPHIGRRVPVRFGSSPLVVHPIQFGLGNKLWCARMYDSSLATWAWWWGLSLPFRIAVHGAKRRMRPVRGRQPAVATTSRGQGPESRPR